MLSGTTTAQSPTHHILSPRLPRALIIAVSTSFHQLPPVEVVVEAEAVVGVEEAVEVEVVAPVVMET